MVEKIIERFDNYYGGIWHDLFCSLSHPGLQAFLPPVIVAFSNFSGIVWTENLIASLKPKENLFYTQ